MKSDRYQTDDEYRAFVNWIVKTIVEDPAANKAWSELDEAGQEVAAQVIIDELRRLQAQQRDDPAGDAGMDGVQERYRK